jgi:hypothetical protein
MQTIVGSPTAVFEGRLVLHGPIARVFPMFSPMGEKEWVPGWNPQFLHPPAETWCEGLVFRTMEESGPATWVVNRFDPASHHVVYHRLEPDHYVARVEVRCREISDHSTDASVHYTFVPLSAKGGAAIAKMTDEAYAEKMTRWQRWIDQALGR